MEIRYRLLIFYCRKTMNAKPCQALRITYQRITVQNVQVYSLKSCCTSIKLIETTHIYITILDVVTCWTFLLLGNFTWTPLKVPLRPKSQPAPNKPLWCAGFSWRLTRKVSRLNYTFINLVEASQGITNVNYFLSGLFA